MSDAVMIALVVAIPSTVTALAAAILSLRNGFKADAAAYAAAEASVKADATAVVTAQTHEMVNSQRAEMMAKIEKLQAEIVTLVREADGRRRQ